MKRFISAILLASVATGANANAPRSCTAKHGATISATFHDGQRFTVQVVGEGADVILIPGLASPREVWAATIAAQRGCFRLHSIQIRGFGDEAMSNAQGPLLEPFVRELADYIIDDIIGKGGTKPMIVGHSLGGLSALMVAARYPHLPERVMVIDAVPYIGTIFNSAATVEAMRPQAERMAAMIKAQYSQPKPIDTGKDPGPQSQAGTMTNHAAGRIAIARWSLQSDPRVVAQALLDDMNTDMRPELPKITAPLTLLYAQDDRAMTISQSTAAFVPQYTGTAKFKAVQVTGSYHFIMLDQPQKFAAELTRFLATKED